MKTSFAQKSELSAEGAKYESQGKRARGRRENMKARANAQRRRREI